MRLLTKIAQALLKSPFHSFAKLSFQVFLEQIHFCMRLKSLEGEKDFIDIL